MEALSYCQLMERCLAAEERVVELAAENVDLKGALNKIAFTYPLSPHIRGMTTIQTPATDHIVAAQRSTFVDEAVSKITESGALTFGDCIVALCQLREGAK